MKSNELQIEQRTYLDKLMLSTVGKQWLMDQMFGTYLCSTGAGTNEKYYGSLKSIRDFTK